MKLFYFYRESKEFENIELGTIEVSETEKDFIYDKIGALGHWPIGGVLHEESFTVMKESLTTSQEMSKNSDGAPFWGLDLNTDQIRFVGNFENLDDAADWLDENSEDIFHVLFTANNIQYLKQRVLEFI